MIDRRTFLAGTDAVFLASPLAVEAQQAAKVPRVGFLSSISPTDNRDLPEAFRQGMCELGYVEGQTIAIEYRFAEGRPERLPALAAKSRLPAVYGLREEAEAGGLIAYGASVPFMYRRAPTFGDKILKDAKPADLPVEQPTKFELVLNLKTAKALGLTIPPSLLGRADEIIQ